MARGRIVLACLGSSRKYHDLIEAAGKLGEFAQSLYPLLIANSDDFGRLSGDAWTVKHRVFPTSTRSVREFDSALHAMNDVGLIVLYQHQSETYIQILKFDEGQTGLHKRTKSSFPCPPDFPGTSGKFRELPSQEIRYEEKRSSSSGVNQSSGAKESSQESNGELARSDSLFASGDGVPSPPATALPAIVMIPLVGDLNYPITESQMLEWTTAFPGVDVMQQLREMRAWSLANPKKRKTKRGVLAFVNTWLAGEQDRCGNGRRPPASAPVTELRDFDAERHEARRQQIKSILEKGHKP